MNAEEGGLSGYGPRITQMFRQLARQLARVFSGEKISDVPVEQPTTFELAINLQAAKALGVKNGRIIFRHILPNALAPVFVTATLDVATAILIMPT